MRIKLNRAQYTSEFKPEAVSLVKAEPSRSVTLESSVLTWFHAEVARLKMA